MPSLLMMAGQFRIGGNCVKIYGFIPDNIRTDFVTNSSSSSFVLMFSSKHRLDEEVDIADPVLREQFLESLKNEGIILSAKKLRMFLEDAYEHEERDKLFWKKGDFSFPYSAIEIPDETMQEINRKIEEIMQKVNGKCVYLFSQGDGTPEDAKLEHDILPYASFTLDYFPNH